MSESTTQSVVVPVEPMPEMIAAWYRVKNGHHFHDESEPTDTSDYAAYRAMLAAAPAPSSLAGGERYRQEAETLAEVLRSRGRNNSKHDINRAANLLDLLVALSPEAPSSPARRDVAVVKAILHDVADVEDGVWSFDHEMLVEAAKRIVVLATRHYLRDVVAAFEQIADEVPYRSGYCQSDVGYMPRLSVEQMQSVARRALSDIAEGFAK